MPRPLRCPDRSALRDRLPLLCLALTTAFAASQASAAASARDLTGLSLEQLLDVKVVGASKYEQRLSEVAAAVSVVTRSEIRAQGWRTVEQALASLPGIHLSYDRQYQYLGTRGFGIPGDFTTRVLLTVNGNRLNDPNYDGAPLGGTLPLDLDLVERIEFIPGPGGAVYGQNAMFGVVNIVTREAASFGGAEVAAGLREPQRLREARASWGGRLGESTELVLSATQSRARGDDLPMDFGSAGVQGIARGLDGARDGEVFGRLRQGAWSAELAHGRFRKDDPTGAYFSDPLTPGQYQSDAYTVGQLQFEDRLDDASLGVSARLFGGAQRYRSTLVYDGNPLTFPADARWHGAELRLVWEGWAGHKLMAGVEWQHNRRQDQSVLNAADPSEDVRIQSSGRRIGLYLQDEWALTPTLSATLGLRRDRDGDAAPVLNPRIGLIWTPAAHSALKLLYGRSHRQPNVYERDYDDGVALVANPSLRGERIDTVELVADHRRAGGLALRASAYAWRIDGLVTLGTDPATGIPQYQSGAPVDAHGLELSADQAFDGGGRLRGSLSLQQVSHEGGAQAVNAPRQLAKLVALTPVIGPGGLRAGAEWRYTSERRAGDGTRLGGVAVASLNLVADGWLPGTELSLQVSNLFDRRYADPGADTNWQSTLRQDGRSIGLRAVVQFR